MIYSGAFALLSSLCTAVFVRACCSAALARTTEAFMLVGILSILAAAGLTLVDQLIKLWATVELLPVGSKTFIPHVLEFYYLLNDGMSFPCSAVSARCW